jgi:four helix bundle protein
MKSFVDLKAWIVGLELVKEVYLLTKDFPREEQFGLTSQLRRATTSILANLAEGFSRRSAADKAYKYTIARGECTETYAFLLMSIAIGLLSNERAKHALSLVQETGRLLSGLIHVHTASCHSSYSPSPIPHPLR